MGFQLTLALLLLKVPMVNLFFDKVAKIFTKVLNVSEAGAEFMFGNLVTDLNTFGYIFAFKVLPTIVFFSALTAILYYLGILQLVVKGMAWVMSRTMGLSGPESLATAANVFIGQTEAPLVVKPYLEGMSRSELLCLMTGGMATIAGGVFAAYVGFLGGGDPEMELFYAKHLITASLISAPAAIVASKIIFPESLENKENKELRMQQPGYHNLLDAISKGTSDGLKLAVNVAVMLVVFTALIALVNKILMFLSPEVIDSWIVESTGGRYEGLNFTYLMGVIFAPFAWLLGTPNTDVLYVGQLLGQKTMINEFVAYAELDNLRQAGVELERKSLLIATYALCGFANFASIGIQIGGIGAIAPGQRKALTELGLKALIAGTIACFLTAAIAGIIAN
jgi:CNT family concentrative nucleoside transporter